MVLGEPLFLFENFDGWVVSRIAHRWAFEFFETREFLAEIVFEVGLRHDVEQLFIFGIDI